MRSKWKTLIRAICFTEKEVRGIWPMTFLTAVVSASLGYVDILFSAEILSELTKPDRNAQRLVILALLLAGLNCLGYCLRAFCKQFLNVQQYILMVRLNGSVAEKAWRMDYNMLCNPDIHGKQETFTNWGYDHGMVAMITQFQLLIQAIVRIGISIALTVEFFTAKAQGDGRLVGFLNHWSFPLVFFGLFVLSCSYDIRSAYRMQKGNYQMTRDVEPFFNRLMEMMKSCFMEYHRGQDIRVFHAQNTLLDKFAYVGGQIANIQEKAKMSFCSLSAKSEFAARLFELSVYLFVGLKAICRAFDVGSLIKYTGSVHEFGNGIALFVETVRDMVQNIQYMEDYFNYQDMQNRTDDAQLPVTESIRQDYVFEFKNVTFTYPGAETPSLSGINCRFAKGEKIAVVGRNGSGKTTFIKLLCRLYDPDEGQILLNGTDIRQYRYEEYLDFFSAVFQDYRIFAFTLGENVTAQSDYPEEKVVRALEDAGFGERLKTLKNRLDTEITKNFSEEGVELSGGESQKVAIARCLYKDAPFAMMDEPTAALDPVAEADIYQRMNSFIQGKGAIYISHRLSSCHFCDRILVFERGRLVEQGTHEELLEQRGSYYKLWNAQAQYYQEG